MAKTWNGVGPNAWLTCWLAEAAGAGLAAHVILPAPPLSKVQAAYLTDYKGWLLAAKIRELIKVAIDFQVFCQYLPKTIYFSPFSVFFLSAKMGMIIRKIRTHFPFSYGA